MMELQTIIKSKIDRLINVELTLGVQPEDLAENIYLNDYERISFYKNNNQIIGEISFRENIYRENILTTLRYTYDSEKRLNRIDELCDGQVIIQWSRSCVEDELINEIIGLMKVLYDEKQIISFVETLPIRLKEKIKKYSIVA